MKKKILFVAPNLHHGGAEAVLVKLINNINLDKYEIKLVLIKKEGEHLSKLSNTVEVIDLNCKKSILAIPKLIKLINKEKPDYVFSIIGQINLILAAIKTVFFQKICFIGRENAVYSQWLYTDLTIKKRAFALVYRLFLKKLDYIIVQSKFMANQVEEYFHVKSNKIFILNNPIEDNKLKILSNESDLGDMWNRDKINLIAVGRIEQVKNYREMVDILAMLPEKYHLNILGDGRERSSLEGYIKQKGLTERVTIHGFVKNPYKYMKNSSILLLTSTRESFPNVVLEANACGTYVISYNMPGGISEIIKENVNGSLIPFGDKHLLVEKIQEVTSQGYNSQRVLECSKYYSMDKYMDKIYDLLA